MAGGTDTDIYFSEDNGTNWSQIFVGNGQNQLYEIGFFEDGSGLICGSGGIMIKFDNVFLGTNGPQALDHQISGFYNKFSETFEIESPHGNLGKIQLYNLNGQLLANLENQQQKARLSAATLSNGIYLVRITSGGKTHSLKLIKH